MHTLIHPHWWNRRFKEKKNNLLTKQHQKRWGNKTVPKSAKDNKFRAQNLNLRRNKENFGLIPLGGLFSVCFRAFWHHSRLSGAIRTLSRTKIKTVNCLTKNKSEISLCARDFVFYFGVGSAQDIVVIGHSLLRPTASRKRRQTARQLYLK